MDDVSRMLSDDPFDFVRLLHAWFEPHGSDQSSGQYRELGGLLPWDSPESSMMTLSAATFVRSSTRLQNRSAVIFNLHPPPCDSGLDEARTLDDTLRPVTWRARSRRSLSAAKQFDGRFEIHQPLVSLHGHIEIKKGKLKIPRLVTR